MIGESEINQKLLKTYLFQTTENINFIVITTTYYMKAGLTETNRIKSFIIREFVFEISFFISEIFKYIFKFSYTAIFL